jgi:Spy/CpxP family protein refolding chaperone
MRSLVAVAAAVVLIAAPLAAQGHGGHQPTPPAAGTAQGGMMGGGMQMGGGEGPMGVLTAQFGKYAPDGVLGMKEHLALSADQEAQLAALVEEGKKAETDAHMPAHAAHMELRKLQAADQPDPAAMREFFMAHHTAEGNMQWLRVEIAIKARALLTPTQRTHVEQASAGGMKH